MTSTSHTKFTHKYASSSAHITYTNTHTHTHTHTSHTSPTSDATSGNVVRRVHTYGKPWDLAPPDVDTVQFGSIGMALHGLAFKLGGVFGGRW